MTRRIQDLIVSVRSKNAGPFTYTFDLFFADAATFHEVVASDAINAPTVAALYGLRADQVRVFAFEPALAIKVSVPRPFPGGDPADRDVAGGQQFAPLLDITV
jgi:hypothetical protein